MNLPLVLDIAIGLIFIYLILSLLASEIQELIATLLQWRAVHLKKSIEVLLTGGEGTEEKDVRDFADRLYSNPLIKNINQEAKGWAENFFRSITWVISSAIGRGRSIFGGSKRSGPSYINAETFTTTLLETSGIPVLVQKLSELKLEEFIQTNLQTAIAEAQGAIYAPSVTVPTDTTTALEEDASSAEALQAQLQTEFDLLTQQFNTILEDFRTNKSTLEGSIKWIAYRLDRYIERCKEVGSDDPQAQAFIGRLQALRREIFEDDPTSGAIAIRPILQSLIRPSLVEIVEAVNDKDSPTYRRLLRIIEQKINGLLPEKLAHELVQDIRTVLEKFAVITQDTSLLTELETVQQSLTEIASHDKSTTESRIALIHQMLSVRDGYISNAESYLSDVDFLTELNALKNLPLSSFKHELLGEIDALLEGFRDITRGTQLHIKLDNLRHLLDDIISSFERGEIQLLYTLDQMLGARDAYIDNASQYIATASIPVKRQDSFLRQINGLKRQKDSFSSVDNRMAIIAWLTATSEELDWEIKHNTEIYRQVSGIVKDKNIDAYTSVVNAIARLPQPIKASLSVLARRAQEKSTTVENEVKQFQFEIETWFDRSMERATGVYKRNAKGVAIILGSLIAFAVNADTFHIVNRLSRDTLLRNAIATSATQVATRANDINAVENQVNAALQDLPLPIGWDQVNLTAQGRQNRGWPLPFLKTMLGWLVSGIAISMGASFWFDLLGKVVNVRNSGKPPEKTQAK
ncbi:MULTISPECIES: hypothetical protein [Trichocoleus]|uniref:Uncharacterized protein n=1 Tax=Trichocoleus desertorum GB2-A4 TaxID=2933944 RepID=A0ABV0JBH8_9CYAN|nr:hypothetical protein [Trichocoleus sp. FACHB-46]MBD1860927.1 hypothetical protein [Trichocoleus sp. FACHB-46]